MNPPFTRVTGSFLAVSVPNLQASAKWYSENLGLSVVKQATSPDKKAAVTILQGNGLSVELVWFADAVSLSTIAPEITGNHQVHGIFKAGILVDDLDSMLAHLKSRDVTMAFEPFFDASLQCRMFAIRDNNGNILQFFGKKRQSAFGTQQSAKANCYFTPLLGSHDPCSLRT
jgi:catechol 2,3-dioxygenase-like lactoylglutathione lyase family enzyme